MRFVARGPDLPDELLIARDQGNVVFFCGAGVSQARAGLANFAGLAKTVLDRLGVLNDSPSRKLLTIALESAPIEGIGTFVATDRVFSLLEREFDREDIHAAVAESLRPAAGADLSAHRLILDLSSGETGDVRLVTTNFDLLFEDCDANPRSVGPINLPDPKRADLQGIVHLHGRVDTSYRGPDEEGFVLSSSDFGRAYVADGWATQFIRSLPTRYSIVFLGYSADDPPVQYLLEALKGRTEGAGRMYAFQSGESAAASALWEHKGVNAIAYDPADGHSALWKTLEAWAARARDVDGWYEGVIRRADHGPQALSPHERGQVAHIAGSLEGARRIVQMLDDTLPASWLYVFDPEERYRGPDNVTGIDHGPLTDPFDMFGLDGDTPPAAVDQMQYQGRQREIPKDAWNALAVGRGDGEHIDRGLLADFSGVEAVHPPRLSDRIEQLGIWFCNVAHQPAAFEWALSQTVLHPSVRKLLAWRLDDSGESFSPALARGWRYRLRTWKDFRDDPDRVAHRIVAEARETAWTEELVRLLIDIRRPRLGIEPPNRSSESSKHDAVFSLRIDYPITHVTVSPKRSDNWRIPIDAATEFDELYISN